MEYRFALDGKATAVLAVGLSVAGALVFASGFLLGVGIHLPAMPALIVTAKPTTTAPVKLAAAASPPPPTAPAPAAGGATAAATAPAAADTATKPMAMAAAPTSAATIAAPVAVSAAGAPPAVVAGTCVDATTPAATAGTASTQGFAIQLGAFLEAANASRLATMLQGRGCAASVSQITDYENRTWNVVRIGQYSSLEDAIRAASDFKRTQGMLALVRPAKSL